ncbi:DUF1989 domain-containing protein [Komagataeibacter europaeus]|uniref:DUF1989 domain-containing protein n=1 Tax=Komagataeibacter europaeus TaxID=33995 RepID=UPI0015FCCE08|nr:aminomethyltransferase family protein [Komagataeibacter europaeus]
MNVVRSETPQSAVRRLRLPGNGFTYFTLNAGDRVSLIDPEGLQPVDLFILGDGAVLDPPDPAAGRSLTDVLTSCEQGAALLEQIQAAGLSTRQWQSFHFSGAQKTGTVVSVTTHRPVACLAHAPAGTVAEEWLPATALSIEIHSGTDTPVDDLPLPLAPEIASMRIPAATARSYFVKAGDYIQIIDVSGKQCSDFLAFDANALKQGVERGLDMTATRTLMGLSSSTPGLHSKYFDETMQPLVEVVQDTVGRHDTFLQACTAKYYDDAGYFGHANCTDNFNTALEPHGVAPRYGWPAVNLFFNTSVMPDGAITVDEPWSRPGDYVLFRALTDLICASSSCADDIDEANGWQPTDIHIRIYDRSCNFPKGIAHRMTPDAAPILTRQTGFHDRTAALTRNFVEYRGFWLPNCFSNEGAIAEYWACRERAAIMDLSALRKFEVIGPDAEELMQMAVTRDVRKLSVGQVVYTAMCYEHGGMIDDGTIFRLGERNFRWVCGDDYCGVWLRELATRHGLKVWVKSSTDALHNIAVQGPKSRDILRKVIFTPEHNTSLDELKWFHFTTGRIGDARGVPVTVSRTGYTGELGYEVWCHPAQATDVWDAIWGAGEAHGMRPLGLEALDLLRVEAGLVFAGYDFCDQTDPFEAGIGFTTPARKTDDYIGREALANRRAHPLRRLVGLDIEGHEAVHHGDGVYIGRAQVGVVTSSVRSPLLGRTIALARLDVTQAEIGTAVQIGKLDGQQKRINATVVRFPHFDPDKTRVRA